VDEDDIARVVQAYADAAYRCQEGGLDGCEVLAESHLLGQFLSPHSNKRSDRFGGTLENRMRFALMVFEAIRQRVGDRFIVGIRTTVHEAGDGLHREEARQVVDRLEQSGLIDFLNLVYGRLDSTRAMVEENMPGIAFPIAPFLEEVGRFRQGLRLPVFHAARITDVSSARHAVRDGLLDMVGMTRAHIADPHIVRKIERGEEDRIRPCVGATYCMTPRRVCIHNAATGREARLPHAIAPAEGPPKRVVVVGGGPAGLEAARVSALRGHEVTLYEAASRLGGQVRLAAKVAWRGDLIGIVDWLARELDHLGVDVCLNTYATADLVAAAAPDIVIVATGGIPDLEWLPGAELCLSTWDALQGPQPAAGTVMVYDDLGQNQAGNCAEVVSDRGATVELVTPEALYAPDLGYSDQTVQRKRFYQKGIALTIDRRLLGVERRGKKLCARLQNTLSDTPEERLVDHIVIERGTLPVNELFTELAPLARNGGILDLDALLEGREQKVVKRPDSTLQLYQVGDAVSSRDVHSAILDSMRLCITL
jgi:hypothetical protein